MNAMPASRRWRTGDAANLENPFPRGPLPRREPEGEIGLHREGWRLFDRSQRFQQDSAVLAGRNAEAFAERFAQGEGIGKSGLFGDFLQSGIAGS